MAQTRSAVPLYQVDSFSPVPFGGNPAAVCLLPESIDPTVMQRIGAEMNLSETAFVEKASRGSTSTNPFTDDAHFNLRWFTPRKEADMCGHATLAAAATLFQEGNQQENLHFETLSGRLSVRRDKTAQGMRLLMDLPACPASSSLPAWLDKFKEEIGGVLTGVQVQQVLFPEKLDYPLVVLVPGTSQQQLEDMQVDSRHLEALVDKKHVTGVCITCSGDGKPYHFLSRFFAPWAGVEEDPVTGSAHAMLGPYWAAKLDKASHTLQARQCSSRGGELQVTVDNSKGRVTVAGHAAVVFKGVLYLPATS